MARVKGLALSIVITSALLLSAGDVTSKDQRGTKPHKKTPAEQSESVQQQQPEVPLSVWQSTNAALTEALGTVKQQVIAAEKQAEANRETWCSPPVVAQILLVIVGTGYLVFAGLQWHVLRLALHVDRPFLLIQSAQLDGVVEPISDAGAKVWVPSGPAGILSMGSGSPIGEQLRPAGRFLPNAKFTFRNYGKGPAILKDAVGAIAVVRDFPKARQFSRLGKMYFQSVQAIGAGESSATSPFYQWETVTWEQDVSDVAAITNGEKRLIVYGRVRYQDVFKKDYETGFCWLFRPPIRDAVFRISAFTVGPEAHNYST